MLIVIMLIVMMLKLDMLSVVVADKDTKESESDFENTARSVSAFKAYTAQGTI